MPNIKSGDEELSMYAQVAKAKDNLPILYQCQDCQNSFGAADADSAQNCLYCLSSDKNNLVVLYMEEDAERAEWLALVDFSAGD